MDQSGGNGRKHFGPHRQQIISHHALLLRVSLRGTQQLYVFSGVAFQQHTIRSYWINRLNVIKCETNILPASFPSAYLYIKTLQDEKIMTVMKNYSLYEDTPHKLLLQSNSESSLINILLFHSRKKITISYTHTNSKVFRTTPQNKS